MAKAIKKLEKEELVKKYAKKEDTRELLEMSKMDKTESTDDRVKKLIEHKNKLIES